METGKGGGAVVDVPFGAVRGLRFTNLAVSAAFWFWISLLSIVAQAVWLFDFLPVRLRTRQFSDQKYARGNESKTDHGQNRMVSASSRKRVHRG